MYGYNIHKWDSVLNYDRISYILQNVYTFFQSTMGEEYYSAIDKVLRKYNAGGYTISKIECDCEYQSIMDKVKDNLQVEMNYTNAQDHQPQAKRNNRTIKECFRVALHRTGYKTIPTTMIEDLGIICAERLNIFPAKHGVSSYYSPESLISGKILDYNKHCKYSYGEYVQAHHENTKTNSMTEQTIDAIYLWPKY